MNGTSTEGYRGRYLFNLVFELVEYKKTYSFPFHVNIGTIKLEVDKTDLSVIKVTPDFKIFKPGHKAKLPDLVLMAGKP